MIDMARLREFDTEQALEKAMRLFWQKGYADTTMRDLVATTGVAHAGLYTAFGDKRSLFQAALQRYGDSVLAKLVEDLEAPGAGRRQIEQLFDRLIRQARAGAWKNGCFMCNTAVEFGDDKGEIIRSVNRNLGRLERAFHGALARARASGEIASELDLQAAAAFLVSVFVGSAVRLRAKSPVGRVESGVRMALRVLG